MKRTPIILAVTSIVIAILFSDVALAGSATWNLHPGSDWSTSTNWTPNTVPNGITNTATFGLSATTGVSISAVITVDQIAFNSGASAFTTTLTPGSGALTFWSTGVTNNSGVTQNFVADASGANSSTIGFLNSASAGSMTSFTTNASTTMGAAGSSLIFYNTSTASNASIVNNGTTVEANGGSTYFHDNSTAGNATITNTGDFNTAGPPNTNNNLNGSGGQTFFDGSATAGSATINNDGAPNATLSYGGGMTTFNGSATANNATINNYAGASGSLGGLTSFNDTTTAGNATINNYGGADAIASPGITTFNGSATAGNATITNYGGTTGGTFPAGGAFTAFYQTSTAGNATLIATGGTNGGEAGSIFFGDNSTGGTARVEVSDNGYLDVSDHNGSLTIGSLEGSGNVFLGANTLSVGSNNLSTTFSGVLQDGGGNGGTGGSLTKIGTGTLNLTGANTYTGGTNVTAGTLLVNNTTGSGTGSGAVQVNAGTLGGSGTIAGAVTVGTGSGSGATLSPGNSPGTLTIQSSLTFKSDSTYQFEYNSSTAAADEVIAHGVMINAGAQFSLTDLGSGVLSSGTVFTAIDDTDPGAIGGFFANLTDHSMVTEDGNTFEVNYEGGDGNDLTLTVESGGTSVPDAGSTFLLLAMSSLGLVSIQQLRSFRSRPATA